MTGDLGSLLLVIGALAGRNAVPGGKGASAAGNL